MSVNEVDDINAFRDKVSNVYDDYREKIGSEIVDTALQQVSE